MLRNDTICALATPPGSSALALLRVSGPDALEIKSKVFKSYRAKQKHFMATRGRVLDVDDGLCVSFPENKSFTGEASFELSLHGSPVIVDRVLEGLIECGARLARPGEFTLRAFESGKIDLCEAEAVADLISSRSVKAAEVALRNLRGALSQTLDPVRQSLVSILCEIEARLDFPDEDLGQAKKDEFIRQLSESANKLDGLLQSAQIGKRLTAGARVALVGLPNAGKSTLLNYFAGEPKAIVHESPGTTRDVIEVELIWEGFPITLLDLAGIRKDSNLDPVEQIGIEKALTELERADLILYLREPGSEAINLPADLDAKIIEVASKIDLYPNVTGISVRNQVGLEALKEQVLKYLVGEDTESSDVLLTKERQRQEVCKSHESIQLAKQAVIDSEPDEIVAFEIRSALQALDQLTGKNCNEDVLDLIFSRFCIGK